MTDLQTPYKGKGKPKIGAVTREIHGDGEPRAHGGAPDAGGMHPSTEQPNSPSWFLTPRGLSGEEVSMLAALWMSGRTAPHTITPGVFEEMAFLFRATTRRKVARTLKRLMDRGYVVEIAPSVLVLARAFNTVPAEVRARIFERDKVCQTCGSAEALTIDHIVARALGGENDEANLQALCLTCNTRKGAEERQEAQRRVAA